MDFHFSPIRSYYSPTHSFSPLVQSLRNWLLIKFALSNQPIRLNSALRTLDSERCETDFLKEHLFDCEGSLCSMNSTFCFRLASAVIHGPWKLNEICQKDLPSFGLPLQYMKYGHFVNLMALRLSLANTFNFDWRTVFYLFFSSGERLQPETFRLRLDCHYVLLINN